MERKNNDLAFNISISKQSVLPSIKWSVVIDFEKAAFVSRRVPLSLSLPTKLDRCERRDYRKVTE